MRQSQKEVERKAHRAAVLARLQARIAELKAEQWTEYNRAALDTFQTLADLVTDATKRDK